jgi:hypothetical protein
MANKPIKKALMILENPWWDIEYNPGRASVYPFFNGLEKFSDSIRVYHATFYEAHSFKAALDDLSSSIFERLYLYIAAHGSKKKVACIHLDNLLNIIQQKASEAKIEGVILGSCNVGMQVGRMQETVKSSNIVWMMGYRGVVDWMESTFIDLAVFQKMMSLRENKLTDRNKIFKTFSMALKKFNGHYKIASDRPDLKNNIPVRKSVSLIIQPRGQGHQPLDMSKNIEDIW